jgi:hypothetical protein
VEASSYTKQSIGTTKNIYDLRSYATKEHQVHFDFDESSRAWCSNKRSVGNGCYTYIERPTRMRRSPIRYQV